MNRPDLPRRAFAAFLFDMDGTILSSIAAAERVWTRWALRHGLDVAALLPTIHGRRAIDTVRRQNLPGVDAEGEAAAIQAEEMDDVEGVVAIAGVVAFMEALPPGRWAVVTSAPRALAQRRLAAAGLPAPPLMITAEDVPHGKPAPDCFLLAAARLGVAAGDCLVFEDAPAGIAAAEAAGAAVLAIDSRPAHARDARHPAVPDYLAITVRMEAGSGLRVVAAGA